MRKLLPVLLGLALITVIGAQAAAAPPPKPKVGSDVRVSGGPYVRHDGGSDAVIASCNSSDPATGGTLERENEPFAIVDPTNPNVVVSGWNDYCSNWEGLGFSNDGGVSWVSTPVPGYPADNSVEGALSPLKGRADDAGDPIAAFDRTGRLFVGGISFMDSGAPTNGDMWVSRWGANAAGPLPKDYLGMVIVGQGTPSRNFLGQFNDKPMLEVDRTGGANDGNVYVCWSRFVSNGQNKIFFSRSTDHGVTFSAPVSISGNHSVQGCDIAVESDGDVFVTWRALDDNAAITSPGIAFARSSDGGASFGNVGRVVDIIRYNPFDGARDCGDGVDACATGYVFARIPLEPRVTADPTGKLPGVFVVYNAVDPATVVPSTSSYSSAGGGRVGQSKVYIVRSTNDGASWSAPVAVSNNAVGHQFFPDADVLDGKLAVMWQDSRSDPAYSVQRPIGNTAAATSSGTDVVRSYLATSTTGTSFGSAVQVSRTGMQPEYEMFDARSVPFIGDYNWIQLVKRADGSLFGFTAWTDNRDVVPGTDPRETVQDGFDVLMCLDANLVNTCPNAGGFNQNIYGNWLTIG